MHVLSMRSRWRFTRVRNLWFLSFWLAMMCILEKASAFWILYRKAEYSGLWIVILADAM
jgi:hypothetical protein